MTLVTDGEGKKLVVLDAEPEDVAGFPTNYIGSDYINTGELKLYDVAGFTDADDLELSKVNPMYLGKAAILFEPFEILKTIDESL